MNIEFNYAPELIKLHEHSSVIQQMLPKKKEPCYMTFHIINTTLDEVLTEAYKQFPAYIWEAPTIYYGSSSSGSSVLATASAINSISFNLDKLCRVNVITILRVVIREVAHLIDYCLLGEMGHGTSWKAIAKQLGLDSPNKTIKVDYEWFAEGKIPSVGEPWVYKACKPTYHSVLNQTK